MTPAIMHRQGLLRDEDIYASLGELILGKRIGREGDERIHYCHMGMGVNDVALAWEVYKNAREQTLASACRYGTNRYGSSRQLFKTNPRCKTKTKFSSGTIQLP